VAERGECEFKLAESRHSLRLSLKSATRNKATITSPFSIAANGDPESSANHFMPKRCYRTTPVLDRLKLRGA
jgi:hypothetical protein